MRDLFAPLLMLGAALGFVLMKAPRDTRLFGLSLMWLSAAASFLLISSGVIAVDRMVWASVIAVAGASYLPTAVGAKLTPLICAAAGLVGSAASKAAGAPGHLLLLIIPAIVLLAPEHPPRLATWGAKIISSWLIAIATLAIALPLISTPGYQQDHMD